MVQARLRTRRLLLVPLAEDHLEHEIDLDSDPEVMRYLGNGKPATREQVVQAHQERLAVGDLVPGLGFWAGFHGREFVGLWFLQPPARPDQGPVEGQAELGSGSCAGTGVRGLPARAPASCSGMGSKT